MFIPYFDWYWVYSLAKPCSGDLLSRAFVP